MKKFLFVIVSLMLAACGAPIEGTHQSVPTPEPTKGLVTYNFMVEFAIVNQTSDQSIVSKSMTVDVTATYQDQPVGNMPIIVTGVMKANGTRDRVCIGKTNVDGRFSCNFDANNIVWVEVEPTICLPSYLIQISELQGSFGTMEGFCRALPQ